MIQLDKSLQAWGTPGFKDTFKQEVAQLGADPLPLHQGLSSGNHVTNKPLTLIINSVAEMENIIRVHAGIFYTGVMGGCSCADDPSPLAETNEYCEVQFDIDKSSAATAISLVME